MGKRQESKTILITGAASGIGRATAVHLARSGHQVIATAPEVRDLEELADLAKQEQLNMMVEALDVTDEADRKRAARHDVDVLMNNAAVGESGPLAEIPLDRLRNGFEVNVFSMLELTQLFARKMAERGSGHIVIIGSTAGLVTLPYLAPYNMTKYALESAADGLRMELQDFGVHVSLIEPGKIDTGFNQQTAAKKHEWLDDGSLYRGRLEELLRFDATFWEQECSPEVVAKDIQRCVEARRPKARYLSPRTMWFTVVAAKMVPSRLRDYLTRRATGV